VAAVNRRADGWVVDFPALDHDLPFEPDPVIEAYKKDVDRTLLQQNLRRTPAERLRNLQSWQRFVLECRRSGGGGADV
jgi:hypothetical protein